MELSQGTRDLARQMGLIALYLFGSRARGKARNDSDYDLAALLENPETSLDPLVRALARDWNVDPLALDIRILNDAAPAFQYQVIRDRGLLYESDTNGRAQYETFLLKEYLDDDYFRDFYRSAWRQRLKEGRFGHRPPLR